MWHIPNNSLQPPSSPLQLHHDIEQFRRKNANLTEGKKLARLDVSSNYPMQYLSLASAQKQVFGYPKRGRIFRMSSSQMNVI